jgi:sugar phosphate isomerase/epimerase
VRVSEPVLSISQITTAHATFDEDVTAYRAAGVQGLGIWENKLPDGDDAAAAERLRASGLRATNAVPAVPSILPLPLLGGPIDPAERIDALCASMERLARFEPTCCLFLTGSALGREPVEARAVVVEGLKRIAEAADRAGVRAGLEPYQRIGGDEWTIASTIGEAVDLLDEADVPNVGIMFDVWHLWNTPTLEDDIRAHGSRFTGVHVSDYREPTRGWADRVLPGDGVANVPKILGALDDAGWRGPYDLEIFSDDAHDGSLWSVPAGELARRGRAALETVWAERPQEQEDSLAGSGSINAMNGGRA